MYKFVCDPEALLTLGLGGGEGRGARAEGGGTPAPQHQDPRRFRVLSHHYYAHHHHRTAAATYAGNNGVPHKGFRASPLPERRAAQSDWLKASAERVNRFLNTNWRPQKDDEPLLKVRWSKASN